MPSDTFAEVVRKLKGHAEAWKINGPEDRDSLVNEEVMAFDCLVAARLLEAAGRECRAMRPYVSRNGMLLATMPMSARHAYSAARAALDELAPELKEVGR